MHPKVHCHEFWRLLGQLRRLPKRCHIRTMVASLILLVALTSVACQRETSDRSSKRTSTSIKKKIYSRSEIRNLLTNETTDEVLQILGKPDHTIISGAETSMIYEGVSKDPDTDNIDSMAIVQTKEYRVAYIYFK